MKIAIGDYFGKLEVIKLNSKIKSRNGNIVDTWLCKCLSQGINCKKYIIVLSRELNNKVKTTCGDPTCYSRFVNHTNKIFEHLIVKEYVGNKGKTGRSYWRCVCKCGKYIDARTDQLLSGMATSCGCLRNERMKKTGSARWNWAGYEEITGAWFHHVKASAHKRKITFDVNITDVWNMFITQKKMCALSGLPISFIEKTISMDRIDSFNSYSMGNIQLVHKIVNISKHMLSNDIFVSLCDAILHHNHNIKLVPINKLSNIINKLDTNKVTRIKLIEGTDEN